MSRPRSLVHALIDRTRHWFYLNRTYAWCEVPFETMPPRPPIPGVMFRECVGAEMEQILSAREHRIRLRMWQAAPPERRYGFGVFVDRTCAAFALFTGSDYVYPFSKIRITLAPGAALILGTYTVVSHRNRGLMQALKRYAAGQLRPRGYRSIVSFIEQGNGPSLSVAMKNGGRVTGTYRFVKLLVWRWHWKEPNTARLNVARHPNASRLFPVRAP